MTVHPFLVGVLLCEKICQDQVIIFHATEDPEISCLFERLMMMLIVCSDFFVKSGILLCKWRRLMFMLVTNGLFLIILLFECLSFSDSTYST